MNMKKVVELKHLCFDLDSDLSGLGQDVPKTDKCKKCPDHSPQSLMKLDLPSNET